MTNYEINKLLIEKFPEFKEKYDDAILLGDGDDSSLYTTFAFVVAVAIEELAASLPSTGEKITEFFNFLDFSIDNHDEAEDVVECCVLEYLFYGKYDLKNLFPFMSERIKNMANVFYKNGG